jgi:flagellar hook-basal body complex protein FliE
MSIPAIAPVSGVAGTGYLPSMQAPGATDGSSFAGSLTGAVGNLQSLQTNSESLAVRAVTGDLTDIHAATLAATRAQVTLELVSAIRNKGVDGFNEIMRMQA